MKNACKSLIAKPQGKGPLGRPRRRWDNIRMDHGETVQNFGLDSSGSGFGPMESSCEHGIAPSGYIKWG